MKASTSVKTRQEMRKGTYFDLRKPFEKACRGKSRPGEAISVYLVLNADFMADCHIWVDRSSTDPFMA
jgi:hypothetical protein